MNDNRDNLQAFLYFTSPLNPNRLKFSSQKDYDVMRNILEKCDTMMLYVLCCLKLPNMLSDSKLSIKNTIDFTFIIKDYTTTQDRCYSLLSQSYKRVIKQCDMHLVKLHNYLFNSHGKYDLLEYGALYGHISIIKLVIGIGDSYLNRALTALVCNREKQTIYMPIVCLLVAHGAKIKGSVPFIKNARLAMFLLDSGALQPCSLSKATTKYMIKCGYVINNHHTMKQISYTDVE
jgi:hypothetical protein